MEKLFHSLTLTFLFIKLLLLYTIGGGGGGEGEGGDATEALSSTIGSIPISTPLLTLSFVTNLQNCFQKI